ncbi:GntR family transcriptional regulator [Roseibium algae]|uniref:GntR family transcriptional regulator n=1 Tax=Roseibium algae TaxID=3123038 RepID=A0ABU8THY4_9HYPH
MTTAETPDHGLSNLQAELARKVLSLAQNGHWGKDEHVSEIRLANTLGTSRTPVRRVLSALEERGLFIKVPNVGFRYCGLPQDELDIIRHMPRSEPERIFDAIMMARAKGEIRSDVSETELAEYFSTSRGMIRRVLMRFSNEGLAERRSGHGWRFAETLDNREAINASYGFRIIIECGALRDPGFEVDLDQLKELRGQQTRLRDMPVAQISDTEWFEANANFHATVVSWAHNRFLSEAMERQNSLRRMTEVAEFTELSADRIRKAAGDHLTILKAIEAGDRETAAKILERHLSRSPYNSGQLD